MTSYGDIEMIKSGVMSKVAETNYSIDDDVGAAVSHDKNHTAFDARNMDRMGRKQELIRNFRPLSAFSFTVVIQATWEFMLISNTQGLVDGGLAGLFWTYVWTFFGFGLVMLCLAEMASMAPISGGQYHCKRLRECSRSYLTPDRGIRICTAKVPKVPQLFDR